MGSKFIRDPEDSTLAYASFLNSLNDKEIHLKQFREMTLLHPTWFLSRFAFSQVGSYKEDELADDLEFFHRFLDLKNSYLKLINERLLVYR